MNSNENTAALKKWQRRILLGRIICILAYLISLIFFACGAWVLWREATGILADFASATTKIVGFILGLFGAAPDNLEKISGYFFNTGFFICCLALWLPLLSAKQLYLQRKYNKRLETVWAERKDSNLKPPIILAKRWNPERIRGVIITLKTYGRCANECLEPEKKERLKKILRISHISGVEDVKRDRVKIYATPLRYSNAVVYR
jgi:hypothetical protein